MLLYFAILTFANLCTADMDSLMSCQVHGYGFHLLSSHIQMNKQNFSGKSVAFLAGCWSNISILQSPSSSILGEFTLNWL